MSVFGIEYLTIKLPSSMHIPYYTEFPKTSHVEFFISLPNINRFQNCFHCHTLGTIGNEVVIEYPTLNCYEHYLVKYKCKKN